MEGTLWGRGQHLWILCLFKEHVESSSHKSFQNAAEKEHPVMSQEAHTTWLDSQTENLQYKKTTN